MLIVIIACATCCATFAGGLFALRLKDKLHLVLGFSAGAVIAVAFFDLLPEAMALGEARYGSRTMMMWAALGFLVYLVLDRIQLLRSVRHSTRDDANEHAQPAVHDHSHSHNHDHTGHHHAGIAPNVRRGWLGASSLSVHSLL